MSVLTAWLALCAILSLLAVLAIWARHPTRARSLAIVALVLSLPVTLPIAASGLSWPVPWSRFTAPSGKVTIRAFKMVEGRAIYIWVDGDPPRYYELPWNINTAQAMQDAQRQAGARGKVGMKAGTGSLFSTGKPNIWVEPQKPDTPKPPPDTPEQIQ